MLFFRANMQFFTHCLQGLGHSTQPPLDVVDKGN